ncbi:MAG: FIST N-terminal domain-containing protein [Betaproteobacteria bacterium]
METTSFVLHPGRPLELPVADWNSPHTLVLALGCPTAQPFARTAESLSDRFPAAKVVYFRAPGVSHVHSWGAPGINGIIGRFEHTRLGMFSVGTRQPVDSFKSGTTLARQLVQFDTDLRGALLFVDRQHISVEDFLAGFNGRGPRIPILGGLTDGAPQVTGISASSRGRMRRSMAVVVGFYGQSLRMSVGIESGFSPCRHRWKVTRADGRRILELDGKPALTRYREALGPLAARLPSVSIQFPLGLESSIHPGMYVVRSVLSIDYATESMTIDGGVAEGAHVSLMYANPNELLEATDALGRQAVLQLGRNANALGINACCVIRRAQLGTRFDEEPQRLRNLLPPGIAHTAFFSKGCVAGDGTRDSSLHGQSSVYALIGEEQPVRALRMECAVVNA